MMILTRQRPSRCFAFSLVEVAIALGIVSFALVGVLGALPLAMTSSRASIDQTRATALATCLFASFRSQVFDKICYVNEQFDTDGVTPVASASPTPINLYTASTGAGGAGTVFYASILDSPDTVVANDPRRVKYTATRTGTSTYQITMRFNAQPDDLTMPGLANRVEITIVPVQHPKDVYRFSSVIDNRSGSAYGATTSS